jgi:hypothetical protein
VAALAQMCHPDVFATNRRSKIEWDTICLTCLIFSIYSLMCDSKICLNWYLLEDQTTREKMINTGFFAK